MDPRAKEIGVAVGLLFIPFSMTVSFLITFGVKFVVENYLILLFVWAMFTFPLIIRQIQRKPKKEIIREFRQPEREVPHTFLNTAPTLPRETQYDRFAPPVEAFESSFQQSKPEELYEQGQKFEQYGAMSTAKDLIGEAESGKLAEIASGLVPIGQGLLTAEQYRKKREDVQEERLKPTRQAGPPRETEEKSFDFDAHVVKKRPVFWKDIIGNEKAIRAIKDAMELPKKYPDMLVGGFPSKILLFGPPGCGKTLLAAAVSQEIGATMLDIDAADIMIRWVGDAERNVGELFEEARKRAGGGTHIIVFMDELDDLLSKDADQEVDRKVRNQFQRELDGLATKGGSQLPLYLIGATNKPWKLNEAIIRRFEKRILVDLPDEKDRAELFKLYLAKLAPAYAPDESLSYEELAKKTPNYSADDIQNICKDVQYVILHEFEEKGITTFQRPVKITTDHMEKAFSERKSSINPKDLKEQEEWMEHYGAG